MTDVCPWTVPNRVLCLLEVVLCTTMDSTVPWRLGRFTYLGRFHFIGPPNSLTCFHDLNKLKHQKTCLPSTHITVHNIEPDTIKWEARLPGDKVKKMQSVIEGIHKCRSISLRQLQSVIGLLNFACRVISAGKALLHRLINLTIGISKPSHHVRLNSEARADLAAWHSFLSSYNGVTMLIDSKWISSESIKLYTEKKVTDAASTQGFAAVFGSRCFNGVFPTICRDYNIAVLELYLIVAALELWGRYIHSVLFPTDNHAVVEVIRSEGWSWPP